MHACIYLNRCDRIIWYGNGLKQHEYTRGETKISDHRPVKAIFTTEITVIRRGKKIRNFFFSDRFEDRLNGYRRIVASIPKTTRGYPHNFINRAEILSLVNI